MCKLRWRLWGLSSPKTSLVPLWAPHVINSSMRSGPSSSSVFTAARLHRPSPALKSILQVQDDFIFVAQSGDWRRRWWSVGDLVLFQYENPPSRGQFDGCAQAGNASSQDYEVGLGRKTLHKRAIVPLRGQSSAASAYAIIEPHAASNNPRAAAAVSGLD